MKKALPYVFSWSKFWQHVYVSTVYIGIAMCGPAITSATVNTITLLQVVWKMLFCTSSRDHGTLVHFCALVGRLKDLNACI